MILDRLQHAHFYKPLHPLFIPAFDFLSKTDLAKLPEGRNDILGDRLFVIIEKTAGLGKGAAKLEAHRRYIDIQLCLGGIEEIGWRPAAHCTLPDTTYNAEKDIAFFADRPETWLTLPPLTFAIFHPHDAHAPKAGTGKIFKAVVKVAVEG